MWQNLVTIVQLTPRLGGEKRKKETSPAKHSGRRPASLLAAVRKHLPES